MTEKQIAKQAGGLLDTDNPDSEFFLAGLSDVLVLDTILDIRYYKQRGEKPILLRGLPRELDIEDLH